MARCSKVLPLPCGFPWCGFRQHARESYLLLVAKHKIVSEGTREEKLKKQKKKLTAAIINGRLTDRPSSKNAACEFR